MEWYEEIIDNHNKKRRERYFMDSDGIIWEDLGPLCQAVKDGLYGAFFELEFRGGDDDEVKRIIDDILNDE